jgi:hypothetical protein
MKNQIIFLFIVGLLGACVVTPTEKKTNPVSYSNSEIGWSVVYPNDWVVLNNAEIVQSEGDAKKALESTLKDSISMNHKNLLWLQKDKFNSFSSTVQPFDSLKEGSYNKTQEALFETMLATYAKQGLQFQYKTGKENIDGLEFKTYFIKFLTSDKKNIILYQVIFDRLINGRNALTLSINFNNDNDKQTLTNIIRSSKLTIRD